jgi:hypothetical protein
MVGPVFVSEDRPMSTTTLHNRLTLEVLGRVETTSLSPVQQPTSLKLLKCADTYQQAGVKYAGIGVYHSYAEYIHALWLESLKTITSYVPQPFLLLCDHKRYIPDCSVLGDGQWEVIELKSRGLMEWPDQALVTAYFAQHNMRFRVLDNEEVLTHEKEALHWRPIIQSLYVASRYGLDTRIAESELLHAFAYQDIQTLGDLISPLQLADRSDRLIALYRLIQRHVLGVDLSRDRLDYDTPVQLCI